MQRNLKSKNQPLREILFKRRQKCHRILSVNARSRNNGEWFRFWVTWLSLLLCKLRKRTSHQKSEWANFAQTVVFSTSVNGSQWCFDCVYRPIAFFCWLVRLRFTWQSRAWAKGEPGIIFKLLWFIQPYIWQECIKKCFSRQPWSYPSFEAITVVFPVTNVVRWKLNGVGWRRKGLSDVYDPHKALFLFFFFVEESKKVWLIHKPLWVTFNTEVTHNLRKGRKETFVYFPPRTFIYAPAQQEQEVKMLRCGIIGYVKVSTYTHAISAFIFTPLKQH